MKTIKLLLLSTFLSLNFTNLVIADEDKSEDIIKYREHAMESLASDSKMMKALLTGKVNHLEYRLPVAQNLANTAKFVKNIFPEGSDFGDTNAKEEIWNNFEDFQQKSIDLEHATQALLDAISDKQKEDILMKKYKSVGASCKACHKKYKEK